MLVIPTATMRLVMTTLKSDTTTFSGALVHLYANNLTITPGVQLASLVEASFTGYAASATFAWSGQARRDRQRLHLRPPAGVHLLRNHDDEHHLWRVPDRLRNR